MACIYSPGERTARGKGVYKRNCCFFKRHKIVLDFLCFPKSLTREKELGIINEK